jgi:hypothetical protein
MKPSNASATAQVLSDDKSAKYLKLVRWTPIPDAATRHIDRWRVLGLHQHARIYQAACKAASLQQLVNAAKLGEIAARFFDDGLGSPRRVQLAVKELTEWGFIRWADPAKLRQQYRSRLEVAGREYPFGVESFDYLERRQIAVRARKAAERDAARRRAEQSEAAQPAGTRSKKPAVAAVLPAPRQRQAPQQTQQPAEVVSIHAATWENHKPKLCQLWRKIVDERELERLESAWLMLVQVFGEKGFSCNSASKYLDWYGRNAREREGAKYPLMCALQPDRVQRFIAANRDRLKPCEMKLMTR